MTEVQGRQQESVPTELRTAPRTVETPVAWYILALAVIVSLSAWSVVVDGAEDRSMRATAIAACTFALILGAGPWIHRHTPARERVVLRMVENNSAVVLVSLFAVAWMGWGEVPPVLAGVLGVAPSLVGLWGLRSLRTAAP